MPRAGKQRTPDGAKAFMEYWIKIANEIPMRTGPGDIYAISDKDCIACRNFIEPIKADFKNSSDTVGLPLFEFKIYIVDDVPDEPESKTVDFEIRQLERVVFRNGKMTDKKTKSGSAQRRAK